MFWGTGQDIWNPPRILQIRSAESPVRELGPCQFCAVLWPKQATTKTDMQGLPNSEALFTGPDY